MLTAKPGEPIGPWGPCAPGGPDIPTGPGKPEPPEKLKHTNKNVFIYFNIINFLII